VKFLVRRYFSGYCTYEIEAHDEETAYHASFHEPLKTDEILQTLQDWRDCDEVSAIEDAD